MKFLIKLFAIILLCFVNLSNCTTIGATTIDELRSELIEIETLAWKIVDGTLPRDRKLEQIIAKHESFASINLGVDYQENEFLTLNHMYDWKYLEKDLITITKLFSEFRRLLKRQLNEGLEELANIDFAETVLQDKTWDIPGIYDNIHSMMVQQGLYYKSLLVSYFKVLHILCVFREHNNTSILIFYYIIRICCFFFVCSEQTFLILFIIQLNLIGIFLN